MDEPKMMPIDRPPEPELPDYRWMDEARTTVRSSHGEAIPADPRNPQFAQILARGEQTVKPFKAPPRPERTPSEGERLLAALEEEGIVPAAAAKKLRKKLFGV